MRTLHQIALYVALFLAGRSLQAFEPTCLRTEWLVDPVGIDTVAPRFSWRVESTRRGARQTAYRILVAETETMLRSGRGSLWDSGRVQSDETLNVVYAGRPLASGQKAYWQVQSWDELGRPSKWSPRGTFSLGLLKLADWRAQWISFRDPAPLPATPPNLLLPPPHHYRKEFVAEKRISRATLYFSALGLAEMHLNGQRVGDAYFESGWADYHQRAYSRAHDVTKLVERGTNCLPAVQWAFMRAGPPFRSSCDDHALISE